MRIGIAGTVIVTASLLTAGCHPLRAQSDQGDTLSRATVCRRAAATMRGAPNTSQFVYAAADLANCPDEGGPSLSAAWRNPPGDSAALRALGEVSPRLRDQDVFQAALSAFGNPGQPRAVRLAALSALVGYYDPSSVLRFTEPDVPGQRGNAYVMLGRGSAPSLTAGKKPLSNKVRQEIVQALTTVGKGDPDDRVKAIAEYIRSRLVATP